MDTKRKIIRSYTTKSGILKRYEYDDNSILISELTYADRDKFKNTLKAFIETHKEILLNINTRKINKFIRDQLGSEYNIHYVNLYIRKIRDKIKKIKAVSGINDRFNSIKRKFNELTLEEQEQLIPMLREIIKLKVN